MNGPFELRDWDSSILDADGNVVAEGKAPNWDEAKERENARMVCAALNAAYYFAKATGAQS